MNRKSIGTSEFRTRLSEILRRTSAGEAFTITRRGEPVAELLPRKTAAEKEVEEAVRSIAGMKKTTVSAAELKNFREIGRK